MQYSSRQGMPDKVPEKLVHEYRSKGGEVGSPVDTSGIPAAQDAKALSFGSVTDVLEEWLQSERGQQQAKVKEERGGVFATLIDRA